VRIERWQNVIVMDVGCALELAWHRDLMAVRRFIAEADIAGLHHVSTSGHLVTLAAGRYSDRPDFMYALPYADPFVLAASMATSTERIRFRTGIMILPLFPTVVVAKQVAQVSILSGGRFDLGVGVSGQEAEYRAVGQDLRTRGRRLEEQLSVLALLWSQDLVTFKGEFHDLDAVGIGLRPASAVPLWIGCGVRPDLLDRVARLADGWLSSTPVLSQEPLVMLGRSAAAAGRRVPRIGGRLPVAPRDDPIEWVTAARAQAEAGVTDITLASSRLSPEEALSLFVTAREAIVDATAQFR
jgi:alkanesulfonate monooxygenase SsuD/methylene tetrahydromethanopterin reductase-like flavin-dependent oxidoreductase (luciferase family)